MRRLVVARGLPCGPPPAACRAGDRKAGRGRTPSLLPCALEALAGVRARPEIVLERVRHLCGSRHGHTRRCRASPKRAASEDLEIATARFIVLFDPAGHEAWQGTTRCVGYLSAGTDEELVDDSMFSEVAWSWLTDALERGRGHPPQRRRDRHPHRVHPVR